MAGNTLNQLRRDTAANWTSANPTLSAGEPGYETDTGRLKLGDGSTAWTSLKYFVGSTPPTSQSGTTYTAVLADANSYIQFTNGSSITFTIPANASVAFPIGTEITVEQNGAGALSLAGAVGVTINSRGSDLTLAGQYAVATVKKVATNTWTLTGDL